MSEIKANLVDNFEAAFHNSIALLTSQEYSNVDPDQDEIKSNIDQAMNKFLEASRQLDIFFVQKRLQFANKSIISEDIDELKNELQRKDQLILKQQEKLQSWMVILNKSTGSSSSSASSQGSGGQTSNSLQTGETTSNTAK